MHWLHVTIPESIPPALGRSAARRPFFARAWAARPVVVGAAWTRRHGFEGTGRRGGTVARGTGHAVHTHIRYHDYRVYIESKLPRASFAVPSCPILLHPARRARPSSRLRCACRDCLGARRRYRDVPRSVALSARARAGPWTRGTATPTERRHGERNHARYETQGEATRGSTRATERREKKDSANVDLDSRICCIGRARPGQATDW